jgi:hypothetical protein
MRVAFLLLPLLAACATAGDLGEERSADDLLADEIWAEIADWTSWELPAGWTDTPVESATHNGYVVTYFNDTLAGWDTTGDAPEGSISVKEGYASADSTELNNVMVMKKIPDYAPDAGDWFWATYAPDGEVKSSGSPSACTGCHAASPTDYVLAEPPPAE